MSNDNLKLMYDKALIEAVKANDRKNKVVIVKLRSKCEFMRSQRNNARRSAVRALAVMDNTKLTYDKALANAVKVNNDKNKIVIDALRLKFDKTRMQINTENRSEQRNKERKDRVSKVLVNLQLDGELNLSRQQIADKCSLTLHHINKLFTTLKKERRWA